MNSYTQALRLAGAIVHDEASFGDYQGTWIARVTWNGQDGYVSGAYGSCSGCDAYEAERGNDSHYVGEEFDSEYHYGSEYVDGCAKCDAAKAATAEWARINYLADGMLKTKQELLAEARRNEDWDMDCKQMIEWLEKQS